MITKPKDECRPHAPPCNKAASRRLLCRKPSGDAKRNRRARRWRHPPRGNCGLGPMSGDLLEVEHFSKRVAIGGSFGRGHFNAVDDVSFTVQAGQPEILAIIGESGSGKTTLARMILNTLAPTSGAIRLRGDELLELRGRKRRLDFIRQVQPILQNPYEAFNPLKRVDRYLYASAVRLAGARSPKARDDAVDAALQKVGLSLVELKGRFPHELSGGQLQRTA